MNVYTTQRYSMWPHLFVIGVDEWEFYRPNDGGTWLVFNGAKANLWAQSLWLISDVHHPTEEQFNFARSFLSLTQ